MIFAALVKGRQEIWTLDFKAAAVWPIYCQSGGKWDNENSINISLSSKCCILLSISFFSKIKSQNSCWFSFHSFPQLCLCSAQFQCKLYVCVWKWHFLFLSISNILTCQHNCVDKLNISKEGFFNSIQKYMPCGYCFERLQKMDII